MDVDWVHIGALMLTCVALLVFLAVGLRAQDQPLPNLGDPRVREEALRSHREQVQQLLETRRRQREEEAARQREEMGDRYGQEGERDYLEAQARQRGDRGSGADRGSDEEQPRESDQPILQGSAEILSLPLNVVCHVGDRFLTTATLHNSAGAEIDEVQLQIAYDPQTLRPLRVSDHGLREFLLGEPQLTADGREGVIRYAGHLARPHSGFTLDMLTVEWETIVPTPVTQVELVTGGPNGTALRRAGRDVLGDASTPDDGVIGTDVTIRPHGEEGDLRDALLIDDPQSLRSVHGLDPRGGVGLRLITPGRRVAVDDTIIVDVVLDNEEQTAIDDLRFALDFDPQVFEVLDAAPSEHRRPGDNWIVGGVNLHDAPFQRDYPFDFHLRNEARNEIGLADYRMGLSRARPLVSGTVARIYLRALAPARQADLTFIHGEDLRLPMTTVRCLGVDVLGRIGEFGDGTESLTFIVVPAPEVPAVDVEIADEVAGVTPPAGG